MNTARQNQVIMEILGYVWTTVDHFSYWQFPSDRSRDCFAGYWDFTKSLDAMHMAEASLIPTCNEDDITTPGNSQRYEVLLVHELTLVDPFLGADFGDLWHAGAAYRARAFIRAWDRWEPGEDETIKLIEPEDRPHSALFEFYQAMLDGIAIGTNIPRSCLKAKGAKRAANHRPRRVLGLTRQ